MPERDMSVGVQVGPSVRDRASEYTALWRWLRSDRELAGRARAVRSAPAAGELGDGIDLISLAVGSLGVAVTIAQTVAGYLAARRPVPDDRVSLILRRPDGAELEVSSGRSAAELEPLIREFLERGLDEE